MHAECGGIFRCGSVFLFRRICTSLTCHSQLCVASLHINLAHHLTASHSLIVWEFVTSNVLYLSGPNLLEQFPYFFSEPKLVLADFLNHFPGYDTNTFRTNWLKSKANIQDVFKTRDCAKDFATEYSDEVKPFLMLLKLFPARFCGRKSAIRLSFEQAVEKFIVFRKAGTPIMNSIKPENTQPYVIAYGPDPKRIQQYVVVVEQQPMNVPRSFTFIDTVDLLFKTHFVFGFCFDFNLNPMLSFIQEYFYDIKTNFKFSNSMIQFYNDMKIRMNRTVRSLQNQCANGSTIETADDSMDDSMDVASDSSP